MRSSITCSVLLVTFHVFGNAYIDDMVDFNKYSLLAVVPKSNEQTKILHGIEEADSIQFKADFWNVPIKNRRVTIGVPNDKRAGLLNVLKENSIQASVIMDGIKKAIEKELTDNRPEYSASMRTSQFKFDRYHEYHEIMFFIRNLAKEIPKLVKIINLGQTEEERDILVVRIGLNCDSEKRVILIDGGMHAREWISPATALYIINELVFLRSSVNARQFLEDFCWYIIPVLNPDGYVYSWTHNRFWKKNRSRLKGSTCRGVDIARNFPLSFGTSEYSNLPCRSMYPGPCALSEKESQALSLLTEKLRENVHTILTLHSFGQAWLFPYCYTKKRAAAYDLMYNASRAAASATEAVHSTTYSFGNVAELLYVVPGASLDWQFIITKVHRCFVIELRDQGYEGFRLDKSQIIPTGEEIWAGIKRLLEN